MQTIQPIQIENAGGPTLRLLEIAKSEQSAFFNERGALCNMVKTMAQSPGALEGYLQFDRIVVSGKLGPKMREQIALVVAQAHRCEYSLSRHASLARRLGLTNDDILASREARGSDKQTAVALRFASGLANRNVEDSAAGLLHAGYEDLRGVGFNDSEVVEIIGQVALNLFENFFNIVANIEVDYPPVRAAAKAA